MFVVKRNSKTIIQTDKPLAKQAVRLGDTPTFTAIHLFVCTNSTANSGPELQLTLFAHTQSNTQPSIHCHTQCSRYSTR
jgi:hypothetical protein